MSHYYLNYSQYLATTTSGCCTNQVGPQGPQGPSLSGPTGLTGAPGSSVIGATGKPRRGPTGPTGLYGGYIGPTGPSGQSLNVSFTFTNLSFNAQNNSVTIPAQSSPLAYYTLTLTNNQSLNSILFSSPLPPGYEAIVFVYGPQGVNDLAYITNSINNSTFASNISSFSSNIFLSANQYVATMSITNDGTIYRCIVLKYLYQ